MILRGASVVIFLLIYPFYAVGQTVERPQGLPNQSEAAFRAAVERGDVFAVVGQLIRESDSGPSGEGISPAQASEILAEVVLRPVDSLERTKAELALVRLAHVEGRTAEIAEGVAIAIIDDPLRVSPAAGGILARLPDARGVPRLIALLEDPLWCRIALGSLMEWAGPAGHAALRAFDPARIPNEDMRQALVEFQRRPGGG